jgi:hypothetical protein
MNKLFILLIFCLFISCNDNNKTYEPINYHGIWVNKHATRHEVGYLKDLYPLLAVEIDTANLDNIKLYLSNKTIVREFNLDRYQSFNFQINNRQSLLTPDFSTKNLILTNDFLKEGQEFIKLKSKEDSLIFKSLGF